PEMVTLVDRLLSHLSLDRSHLVGVGVGAPGPLSQRTGRIIRSANLPGWVDVPVGGRLREGLGVAVTLDNDGNAAAFGEYWAGAGRGGGDDLVMLTLGTGVGAGVVLDGRILHGHFENAAELGHMIVAVDGLPCSCGQRGCLERYASASGVTRRVVAAIQDGEPCALADAVGRGETFDAERVVECAQVGDPLCLRIFDEACLYLAVACINIQHTFNPARVVLGGGMSKAGVFLLDRVDEHAHRQTWSLHKDLPAITLAELGYDAGVIGAAGLAWQQIGESCSAENPFSAPAGGPRKDSRSSESCR
ncbi:MAG: ROK family protein, partial [Phycisphaerae bacterium]